MGKVLDSFESAFLSLDRRNRQLLVSIPDELLFSKPRATYAQFSCGEYILRSAAMVEKTFGGITTRLWDDPFEWTLPEKLSTRSLITNYLDEVEATRKAGFGYFRSDSDLSSEMPAPTELKTLGAILIEALTSSEHYAGRAFAVFQFFSDEKLPRR
jgi:hypothetical protein